MAKWKTQYNAKPEPGETNFGPSLTVPDMTMSIPQILERHARGLHFTAGKVPIYESDQPGFQDFNDLSTVDLSTMDLADREELIDRLQDEQKQLQAKLQQQKKQFDEYRSKYRQKDMFEDDDDDSNDPGGFRPEYPKKTRGAGAEPRNDDKRRKSSKNAPRSDSDRDQEGA